MAGPGSANSWKRLPIPIIRSTPNCATGITVSLIRTTKPIRSQRQPGEDRAPSRAEDIRQNTQAQLAPAEVPMPLTWPAISGTRVPSS